VSDPRLHQRPFADLILSFYLPALLFAFAQGLLIPVLPLYAKSLQVSYGLIGLVSGGASLGMLLGDVPSGVVVRRLGHKRAMLLGIGCTAVSTLALFWARSVPEVVVYRLVSGFGQALYGVARHAFIAGSVRVAGRGRAISLFGGLMRVGRFVGPLAGGTIAKSFGLRVPFLFFGLAYAGAFVAISIFVWEGAVDHGAAASPSSGLDLRSLLRTQLRTLAPAGLGQLFAQMIRAGRQIVVPLYAADVIGLDVQAIGLIVSIASAVDMLFFYPAGWIMDHLGRKYAIVPSFVIQAIGMGLIPLAESFAGLLLAASLIGFGNGFSSGSMMTLGADLAPEGERGAFLGVWRLIGDVGHSGGPLVVGAIADLVALPTAALIMSVSGLLASTTFAFLVPETLQRRTPTAAPSTSGE
jgi:MFS family permease